MRVLSTFVVQTTPLPKVGLLTSHQKTFRGFYLKRGKCYLGKNFSTKLKMSRVLIL